MDELKTVEMDSQKLNLNKNMEIKALTTIENNISNIEKRLEKLEIDVESLEHQIKYYCELKKSDIF